MLAFLFVYCLSIAISWLLFRIHFRLEEKEDISQEILVISVIFMFIPLANIVLGFSFALFSFLGWIQRRYRSSKKFKSFFVHFLYTLMVGHKKSKRKGDMV